MRAAWRTTLLGGVAALNILSTLLPLFARRHFLIVPHLPPAVILGAQHAVLLLGITMLLLAHPVAMRHRRSAYLFIGCAALVLLAGFVRGLDILTLAANCTALVMLWSERRRWHAIPLRYTVVDIVRLAVLLLVISRVYFLLSAVMFDRLETLLARGLFQHGPHPFVMARIELQLRWFDQSAHVLPVFLVLVFVGFSWTSLVRAHQAAASTDLYERFGRSSHNSLAYLARRNDVLTYLDPEGRGAVSYRQVGRVALQIGAILAPTEYREVVYRGFCAYCRSLGLIPAAVALTEEERDVVWQSGLRTLAVGTEAVVDLREFAVERLNKKMRWAQRSLTKHGYRAEILAAKEITPQFQAAFLRIDAEWRQQRGGQMHGCCMTLGRLPTSDDANCLVGVLYDPVGSPIAYLTLLPGGEGVYSLDLTRRTQNAPNATMEFLLIEALVQLRTHGASTVSLNFSTFSDLAATHAGKTLLGLLGKAVQLHSLETFNNKFLPQWSPRYLAFPSWLSLPDVLYAIVVVEGVDRMLANACARSIRHVWATLMTLFTESEPRTGVEMNGESAI